MMKKGLIFFFIIFLAGMAYYFSKRREYIAVTVYKVAKGEVKSSVSNTRVGTIKACRRAYLAPSTGGNVAKLFVKEGDKVKQQQVLLEVWNGDLKAQLKLQQAQIKVSQANAKQVCELAAGAKRDAKRVVRLKKVDHIISAEQVDQSTTQARAQASACLAARAEIEVSKANLAVVEQSIERTVVRAPFDGTIAEINAELGEYITPSPPGIPTLPPIDILDISCLTVSAPIDEVDATQINVGMSACVSLDAFKQPRCSGVVSRIAPYVLEKEKQARTVEVEVKLNKPKDLKDLLPGYSADIEVLIAQHKSVLRVPAEAVLERNQVLLIGKEGKLKAVKFKAGLANWNYVEVLSGLSAGDLIVRSVGRDGVKPSAYVVEDK
ncbi:MAG: efflux RND transporter periplasmic adaptor subunit [Methylococcales bacterium]